VVFAAGFGGTNGITIRNGGRRTASGGYRPRRATRHRRFPAVNGSLVFYRKRRRWCSHHFIRPKRRPRAAGDLRAISPFVLDARPPGVLLFLIHAGVAKLVYALDSKSSGIHFPCRFESDPRYHTKKYPAEKFVYFL